MFAKQHYDSENKERRQLNDPNLTDEELEWYIREDEKDRAHRRGFLFLFFLFVAVFIATGIFVFSL